uniref:NDP-glucose--starch glucosyltransferase n=1 Tax=Amorphophallus konjac TaxID=78372 RepID=F8U873_AMOKO|nr:putative starch synthase [Amorphophallus konjac]
MATVTASTIISRSAHGGVADVEPRASGSRKAACLRNQATTFHGLRAVGKVSSTQAVRRGIRDEQARRSGVVVCVKSANPSEAITCEDSMNIVFVSTEVAPWSKTGGLGDVAGGLPPALAKLGHRVMTVSPRYDQYKDAWDTSVLLEIKVRDTVYTVRFFHCYKRGVDRVFIDHPLFLEKVWGKTGGKLYGPVAGEDYKDNQIRFTLLCLAALEAPRILNLNNNKSFSGPYGEDVVFVCNDWHTGVLPCYLKSMYKLHGLYKNAKVAFCIHNMAYQGRFAFSDFSFLNLPETFKSSFDFIDGYNKPVKGRKINWMKAGILEADKVFTVSPYYAEEVVSGVARGVELDNIIRKTGITGIVNGMDVDVWNPVTDKYICANYDSTTVLDAKRLNKEDVQATVGLPVDPDIPLIAFIGRLEEQKGSDILVAAIPKFIRENVQIVVLGTGKKVMEKQIMKLEEDYPDKARGIAKFDAVLAHKLFAGADLMIITSRFEPCGLIQLQAMQYGTPSMCASTGGLVNTIVDGVTGFHMGAFHVDCDAVDPKDVEAVATTVRRAIRVYGTDQFSQMIRNCMAKDLSWKGPSKKWEEELRGLLRAPSGAEIEVEEEEFVVADKVTAA